MSLFKQASQGEILRAAQKDSSFTDKFQRNVSNFCLQLLGPRVWLKYKWLLEPSTRFFYYMITTGLDLQTLGEEVVRQVETLEVDQARDVLSKLSDAIVGEVEMFNICE